MPIGVGQCVSHPSPAQSAKLRRLQTRPRIALASPAPRCHARGVNENKSSAGLSPWFKRAALVLVVAVLFSQLDSRLRAIEAAQKRMVSQVELLDLAGKCLEISERQSEVSDSIVEASKRALATNSPPHDLLPPPVPLGEVNAEHVRALSEDSPASVISKVDTLCRKSNRHPYSLATLQAALASKDLRVEWRAPDAHRVIVRISTNSPALPK